MYFNSILLCKTTKYSLHGTFYLWYYLTLPLLHCLQLNVLFTSNYSFEHCIPFFDLKLLGIISLCLLSSTFYFLCVSCFTQLQSNQIGIMSFWTHPLFTLFSIYRLCQIELRYLLKAFIYRNKMIRVFES